MIVIFGIGMVAIERDSDSFLYESSTKLDMLRTTKQPRVIFVGGSNLAFGLNSKAISDSIHKNIINNALHAGLGLKFIIDDVDGYLLKGDSVVISPEYEHFFGEVAYGDPLVSPILAEYRHDMLFKCNIKQLKPIIKGTPKLLFARMELAKQNLKKLMIGESNKPNTKYAYRKSGFNEYGDEISHYSLENNNPMIEAYKITDDFNEEFYQYFLSVIRGWESRGIRVIIMPPVIYDKQYNLCMNQIDYLSKRLRADGFPFHAETSLFAYPDTLMFNTSYHINKKGVDKRTEDVIKALRK